MGIFNNVSKFESQVSSYTYLAYFFVILSKEMVISYVYFTLFVHKYKTSALFT